MDYRLVYDVTRDWLTFGMFAAFAIPTVLAIVGTLLVVRPERLNLTRDRTVFRWFYFVFTAVLALFVWVLMISRHLALVETTGTCRTVEGEIKDFVPMPAGGHAREHFTVAGVAFSYSDFGITGGFNNTAAYGGPARAGRHVRICYVPNIGPETNLIVRLEVAD